MNDKRRTLQAVIFDLDGVLVSTSKYHARAWAELVRSLGHEPPADLEERVKGISRMASLKIALGEHAGNYSQQEITELADRKNAHYRRLAAGIGPADLFPGARALFDDLRAAGVKILLGSASKNAKPIVEGLGVADYFADVIDGYRYKHGKPHPDIFLTAARAAAAEPAECIVVEDAAAGISSALDGGFVTVGIGSYESLKHAHRYVRSLEELSAAALRDLQQRWRCDLWTMATEISGELANRQMGLSADAGSPNLQVEWTIEGERLDLAAGTLRHAETRLDLRTRLATTTARWTSPGGREMILTHRRFRDAQDAQNPSRRFHQYELEPLSFSGEVAVAARIGAEKGSAEKGSGTFSSNREPPRQGGRCPEKVPDPFSA